MTHMISLEDAHTNSLLGDVWLTCKPWSANWHDGKWIVENSTLN